MYLFRLYALNYMAIFHETTELTPKLLSSPVLQDGAMEKH